MNPDRYIDLHLHTIASDGSRTASEVVRDAKRLGLKAISITDHDTVGAVEEAKKTGLELGVEVIAGIELSAYVENTEVHILGYYFDETDSKLLKRLAEFRRVREKRVLIIIDKLKSLNLSISIDDVMRIAKDGSIGRLHVARVLVEKGIVDSIKQAFDLYLTFGRPAYASKEKITTKEAIQMILEVGGVPVLAHPSSLRDDSLIPKFVQEGLIGIEVYHSDHWPEVTDRYRELAKTNHLLMTGGSDCHGLANGKVLIGSVKVSYTLLEPLKNAHQLIRKGL